MATKGHRFVITYFSMNEKENSLYFAETNSTPIFNNQAENTTSDRAAEPAIQTATQSVVQPATRPDIPSQNQTVIPPTQSKANNTSINSPIVGNWRRGNGVTGYGGRWSSTGYQYTFNANGTYTYVIKTYVEDDPKHC